MSRHPPISSFAVISTAVAPDEARIRCYGSYGDPPVDLPPADGRTSGRRRAVAEWLASKENPRTARVMGNRIWRHDFGRGITATLDNFGKMGKLPTHPDLLGWLAVDFMQGLEHQSPAPAYHDLRRLSDVLAIEPGGEPEQGPGQSAPLAVPYPAA